MSSRGMKLVIRAPKPAVALETTLLVHGVPRAQARDLFDSLSGAVRAAGANPAVVGIVNGVPTVGLTGDELSALLDDGAVPKANTANLGALLHRGSHGATTVSTTMELAAAASVSVFATGAIGGVHKDFASSLDISSDLAALTRFPVAVVTSGVKSLLNVAATREALETLGIPVVGYKTDAFPAFYRRASDDGASGVDSRFDDIGDMARFVRSELARTGRGVVIANPIPEAEEIALPQWHEWISAAESEASSAGVRGRGVTPFILGKLHELSQGATLRANIALAISNASLAGALATHMDA